MAIQMVKGYAMPPGMNSAADYGTYGAQAYPCFGADCGGYGETSLRPYWYGPERIGRTLPALNGYGAADPGEKSKVPAVLAAFAVLGLFWVMGSRTDARSRQLSGYRRRRR